MFGLYIVVIIAVALSLLVNKTKTMKALNIALKKMIHIFPSFLLMFIAVSITLYFISDTIIMKYLGGENKYIGTGIASILGSVTLLPGFIAYPLCGVLLKKGVPYMVLASFTTTLMMVGVLTYPVEKKYFGNRITIIRNLISFFIAIIVSFIIGIFFGEIF